jgi:SAM-dependent methyltransferase
MAGITKWIDQAWYPAYLNNWDDNLFRERILDQLKPDSVILDLGAGAGIVSQMNFKGLAQRVCGVDLDSRVVDNAMLDEGRISDAGEIPYDDGVFDVIFSDNVMEHLSQPLTVYKEIKRVLKPGGKFLFKTPNKWHYMPTIARMTPHGFHQYINRVRGRSEVDTFPTCYCSNTLGDVKRLSFESGLVLERLERIEGRPEYLRMAWPLYLLGVAYERLVNSTDFMEPFRVLLIGTISKPL